MQGIVHSALLAVHIPDGMLVPEWWLAGFVVAGLLVALGAWRIRDEEIPQAALLTSVFFVAALVPLPGPVHVHLLLNGLLGVVLGRRAALAIPVGLFLQAVLFGHGGYTTLGVNSCVMTLPALLAGGMFSFLQRVPWVRRPWFRAGLTALCTLIWTLSLVYSLALLCTGQSIGQGGLETGPADRLLLHPATLGLAGLLAGLAAWLENRLENAPEFPLGLLVGLIAVLATVLLNGLTLLWGGVENWHALVLIIMLAHLPIAVVESVVLGFTVGFLARVKPEMIGWTVPEKAECSIHPVS